MESNNIVGWFEIPVINMDRAKKFYDAVFELTITIHHVDGFKMGWFPMQPNKPGATGSLVQHESYIPSDTHGAVIYFSCSDVANELSRVTAAGGTIMKEKSQIGDGHGFMALIKDTEGNRIALHSNQ